MSERASRNWGLDLARVTEVAARAAGRWMGLGKRDDADLDAIGAMATAFSTLDIAGHIVVGEEGKVGVHSALESGRAVGTGAGPAMDVVVDPIDGRNLLAQGHPGAIAVAAVAAVAPCGRRAARCTWRKSWWAVRLTISIEALKALPELQAKVAGASYTQRSIPTDCLALGKGIPVTDESEQAIGHFSGVVMGSERRIEQILIDQGAAPAMLIDQLSTCTEDGLRVRRITTP